MPTRLPTPPHNGARVPRDMSVPEIRAEEGAIRNWLHLVRSGSGDLPQSDINEWARQRARLRALTQARGFR